VLFCQYVGRLCDAFRTLDWEKIKEEVECFQLVDF